MLKTQQPKHPSNTTAKAYCKHNCQSMLKTHPIKHTTKASSKACQQSTYSCIPIKCCTMYVANAFKRDSFQIRALLQNRVNPHAVDCKMMDHGYGEPTCSTNRDWEVCHFGRTWHTLHLPVDRLMNGIVSE